ncbi:MAG TPA: type II CRISPR RNA-guided endonuclease Cas9, partial [Pirellulaceae bacterium]|nr:type II CRISPR RNA-guided endonuclease Cas9 [Pirellulaceae bacterium]
SGVFGEDAWNALDEQQRDAVNRSILKFDPQTDGAETKLHAGVQRWWGLDEEQADAFIAAWKERPKIDKRINLSRKALKNLLPFLREGKGITEARQEFAKVGAESELQAKRYDLRGRPLTKKERHFVAKHPDLLPPAPKLSNPVVRKAIHEVRRHLNEYLQHPEFGKPDRVVIELARSARQSEKVRNATLARNRKREKQRQEIIDQFELDDLSLNQQNRRIERVLLCRQQRGICAYTGESITEAMAANGTNLEVDHIVPRSRSHDNSMNNKVLVFRDANRDKANRTLKEWLGADSESFQALLQRLHHLGEAKTVESYFTKKDYDRKWENLNRDAPATEEFVKSQLTDTAYASKQVAAYISEALFRDKPEDKRFVFTTKGRYTAALRRDWGLLEGEIDREASRVATEEESEGRGETAIARRSDKDRRDHLH